MRALCVQIRIGNTRRAPLAMRIVSNGSSNVRKCSAEGASDAVRLLAINPLPTTKGPRSPVVGSRSPRTSHSRLPDDSPIWSPYRRWAGILSRSVDGSRECVLKDRRGVGGCRSIEFGGRNIVAIAERGRAGCAGHQFRRIRPRLPARLVSESLDFLPPAEERLQLAGAVDEAEYIHPVFQGPLENEHPFEPRDPEHA